MAHYGWHQFIERYIEWSGFSFTHLRPEIFMQNLLGYGGESYVKQGVIRHYVGNARLSWVDCDDVAAVAAASLLDPARHGGQTYRLGYEARTYDDIAEIFARVLGQPFTYEPLPPEEFLRNVLAAGAEPAYMKCVYDSYVDFNAGRDHKADEVFDNFPAITGRDPRTLADFAGPTRRRSATDLDRLMFVDILSRKGISKCRTKARKPGLGSAWSGWGTGAAMATSRSSNRFRVTRSSRSPAVAGSRPSGSRESMGSPKPSMMQTGSSTTRTSTLSWCSRPLLIMRSWSGRPSPRARMSIASGR